jgi:cytochrome P450
MRKYEERVSEHTATLIAKIDDAARSGTPFNVAKWFHFYGWDVMGHVGFGRSFEMLRDGIKHHFYTLVEENVVLIALFSRLIWLFPIFKSIPVVNYKYKRGRAWIEGFARARVEDPPDGQDVFASILGDYNDNPRKTRQDWFNILGDCSTLIVAGSDTTAAALACLFFQFALYPDAYKKLQAEVDDLLFSCLDTSAEGAILDAHALGKLPYLQACIDEALRLYHPIPSGMQRQTGPQGLQIGRTHIPRDTIVQMPLHLLHRDARCFVRPDAFVPERWTGRRDELVRDASVFAPFGVGRFGCVGKQLGLMEMRRVAALVAREYDVRLADGVRAQEIEAGIEDYFTMSVPELNLLFTPRK